MQRLLIWSSRMKGNHRNQEILAGIFGRTNLLLWALEWRRTLDSVHRNPPLAADWFLRNSGGSCTCYAISINYLHLMIQLHAINVIPVNCHWPILTKHIHYHSTRIQMQIPQWWNKTLRPVQPTTWLQAYAATHRGEALVEVSLPRKIRLFSWFSAMNSIIT